MLENARFLLEEWAFSSIFDVGEAMCLADEPSALQLFGVVSYEVVIRITFGN